MEFFSSTLIILAVLGYSTGVPVESQEDWSIENLHQLKREALSTAESFIEETLKELGDEYCKEANLDLTGPLQEVKQRAKSVDTESQTVCALVRDKIEHVFEPLTSAIDKCGEEGRLGPVATSVIKVVKAVVQYACSLTGEQILELVNPCVDEIISDESQCSKDVEEKFNLLNPETATGTFVEEVCKILPDGKKCLIQELNKCNLEITRNTFLGLYDAVVSPCK